MKPRYVLAGTWPDRLITNGVMALLAVAVIVLAVRLGPSAIEWVLHPADFLSLVDRILLFLVGLWLWAVWARPATHLWNAKHNEELNTIWAASHREAEADEEKAAIRWHSRRLRRRLPLEVEEARCFNCGKAFEPYLPDFLCEQESNSDGKQEPALRTITALKWIEYVPTAVNLADRLIKGRGKGKEKKELAIAAVTELTKDLPIEDRPTPEELDKEIEAVVALRNEEKKAEEAETGNG